MAARDYGEYGGITRALELVGERWALLIVRDLLVGPRRYGELAAGLPRIPTNILAARLKDLQAAGVPVIHRLISGELAPDRAIATGAIELLRCPSDLLDRFANTFHLAA